MRDSICTGSEPTGHNKASPRHGRCGSKAPGTSNMGGNGRSVGDEARYPATSAMRVAIRLAADFTGSLARCA